MDRNRNNDLPDRLVNVHEAADLLGLKVSTLRKWTSQRRLPVVRLGRATRYRLSAMLKLLDKATVPAIRSSAL